MSSRNVLVGLQAAEDAPSIPSANRILAFADKASSWSLRGFKHAAIWAVLACSLLPVYLILDRQPENQPAVL